MDLKKDLKCFEKRFMKEHGRRPLKEDIEKEGDMAAKYKAYAMKKIKNETIPREIKEKATRIQAGLDNKILASSPMKHVQSIMIAKKTGEAIVSTNFLYSSKNREEKKKRTALKNEMAQCEQEPLDFVMNIEEEKPWNPSKIQRIDIWMTPEEEMDGKECHGSNNEEEKTIRPNFFHHSMEIMKRHRIRRNPIEKVEEDIQSGNGNGIQQESQEESVSIKEPMENDSLNKAINDVSHDPKLLSETNNEKVVIIKKKKKKKGTKQVMKKQIRNGPKRDPLPKKYNPMTERKSFVRLKLNKPKFSGNRFKSGHARAIWDKPREGLGSGYFNSEEKNGLYIIDTYEDTELDEMMAKDDFLAKILEMRNSTKTNFYSTNELINVDYFTDSAINEEFCIVNSCFLKGRNSVYVDLSRSLKELTGFNCFKEGQESCIRGILAGQSMMAMLPTGGGKSLCYQLPSFILSRALGGITLVVCPLLSLMMDQLFHLPPLLNGACFNSNLDINRVRDLVASIFSNKIHILYLSPEKLMSSLFQELLNSPNFPQINLVCIDEAHCISEWSHNFRSAYLRMCKVLLSRTRPKTILSLSASLTVLSAKSICRLLQIPEDNIIRTMVIRKNLILKMSAESNKMKALCVLLKEHPYKNISSIIIYCSQQYQADEVASQLRSEGFNADSYHAGKSNAERNRLQLQFMSNELTIIVATVAFGMGLNKSDVRAVIHYTMPRSIENYIQEIGRAGRDNLPSFCHLFLHDEDYQRLRSLVFMDDIDLSTIKRLLDKIASAVNELKGFGEETNVYPLKALLDMDDLELYLDIRREVIQSSLTYLEVHESKIFKLLSPVKRFCIIKMRNTDIIETDEGLGLVRKISSIVLKKTQKYIRFETLHACHLLGFSPPELRLELFKLQSKKYLFFDFEVDAFCIEVRQPLSSAMLEILFTYLCQKNSMLEETKILKLDQVYKIFKSNEISKGETFNLDEVIEAYFLDKIIKLSFNEPEMTNVDALKRDIRQFVESHIRQVPSARSIARILHGLSSPKYPREQWQRDPFWNRHHSMDYRVIKRLASEALDEYRRSC